jgi:hypothetical protein
LHMVMSTSQNSRTLQLTIHMEVKWVIFVGATMVFILQVQWWGAISNSFLIIYIYIYIYTIARAFNVPWWRCSDSKPPRSIIMHCLLTHAITSCCWSCFINFVQ